ncbi:MAG: hypothetical protein RIQ36_1646 [Pseudomonadota bacterium]|jgi:hypothetical protein
MPDWAFSLPRRSQDLVSSRFGEFSAIFAKQSDKSVVHELPFKRLANWSSLPEAWQARDTQPKRSTRC